MERRSFIRGAPPRGFIPLLSYLSIPPRHSSTITLPSPCFFFFFYGVAAAFSPFFSVHSLSLPTLLLSGTACLRVSVRRSLPGTTLTLFHAFTQEELQPLLFVLLSSYEWMDLHMSTEQHYNVLIICSCNQIFFLKKG